MLENRIIKFPDGREKNKVPVMPILVLLKDGTIGEAKTLKGVVAIIIGNEYLDAEDNIDEWNYRLELARAESMRFIAFGINSVIKDCKKGIIKENYAADIGDPDYKEFEGPSIEILIDNDKTFILSLVKLGAISIFEREDSFIFRKRENESEKNCSQCIYVKEFCIYNEIKKINGCCSSFCNSAESLKEYKGGTYIDIYKEYDIDELIKQ